MKKIISIILASVLCLSLCVVPAFAEYSPAENFALALNMTSKDGYVPTKTITRAEFAEIVANLCNLMDANKNFKLWQEYVYGSDTNNTFMGGETEEVFDDVDSSLPQYDAIMKVYKFGYMNGMTESHFGPNYDITMGEVVKVIVSMLGYDEMAKIKGGYPNGYIQAANTLKLSSGMKFAASDYATYEKTAQLIYNALDIPVYEIGAIGDDYIEYVKSEETFLKARLGLEKAEGIMTDNGVSSVYTSASVGEESIVVDGKTIRIENCEYAREYLGRNVEAYYMNDGGSNNHLVYAAVSEYDRAFTIDARDFVSYTGGEFSYVDENEKLDSETVNKAKLIYNGVAMGTWQTSLLYNIKFGDITIASTQGDKNYDLIIVNEYMVGKVTKKDAATQKIYTKDLYDDMNDVKTLDLSDENKAVVRVCNAQGKPISFTDINVGDIVSVLKSNGNEVLKIVVSTAKVTDFILEDYEISDELTFVGQNTSYDLQYDENLKEEEKVDIGSTYTLYFDFMGNFVWYEKGATGTALKKAILLDIDGNANGFEDNIYVRLYGVDGKMKTPVLAEKVIVNGKRYDSKDVEALVEGNITDVILYQMNSEETEIKVIVTPLDLLEADTDNRGWYRVTPKIELMNENITVADWNTHVSENGYMYSASNGYLFSAKFGYSTSATTTISIPNSETKFDNEKMFSVNATTFQVDTRYIVNGYSADPVSLCPEVLVTASNAVGGARDVPNYMAFLVSKVSRTVDDEGEEVTSYKGIYFDYLARTTKEMTFKSNEDAIFIGPNDGSGVRDIKDLPADQPIYTTPQPYNFLASGPAEVEAGDIIRFSATSDGMMNTIRLCYDNSTGNYFSSGRRSRYVGGPEVCENETVVAYPAYRRGTTLKFAFNGSDPSEYENKDVAFDENKFRVMTIGTGWIYVVEESPKGVTVKKATIDEIVTYEESGAMPGKIVLLSQYGNLNYGTVIYR